MMIAALLLMALVLSACAEAQVQDPVQYFADGDAAKAAFDWEHECLREGGTPVSGTCEVSDNAER